MRHVRVMVMSYDEYHEHRRNEITSIRIFRLLLIPGDETPSVPLDDLLTSGVGRLQLANLRFKALTS